MRGNTPKRIVKWAILGTGSIANDMVQCLKQLDSCEVVTVGSRSYDNAKWFQTKWNIPRSYDSYSGAAADEEVDVCYIATPMERHFQDCMAVIQLGKAVLCEKSMAPNHIIANEIIQSAKDANVLFVHGVWSRFFPAMQKVKNLVESSAIGEVKSARASFCQSFRAGECSALLEVGIYCVQFLQWVLDDPNSFMKPTIRGAFEKMSVDGVYDEYVIATIEFPHGKVGTMECSLGYCSERSAAVYGTTGVIEIPYPFWCPTEIKVTKMTGPGSQQISEPKVFQFPLPANVSALQCTDNKGNTMIPGFNFVHSEGLWYEAAEVNRCFLDGLLESPLFPSSQCHDILRLVSDIQKFSRMSPIATNSPRKRKSQMQEL